MQTLEGELRLIEEGASREFAFRRDFARQVGWRPAELHAVERGLAALRADWPRRGGTPLPGAAAAAGR